MTLEAARLAGFMMSHCSKNAAAFYAWIAQSNGECARRSMPETRC